MSIKLILIKMLLVVLEITGGSEVLAILSSFFSSLILPNLS